MQLELNLIQNFKLSLNILNEIQILLNSNSIEKKWNAKNWCKKYWKFACDDDVVKKNSNNTQIQKTPFHSFSLKVS
jgi:hypothetical protein